MSNPMPSPDPLERAARARRLMAYPGPRARAAVATHPFDRPASYRDTPRPAAPARLPRGFQPAFLAVSLMDLGLTWFVLNVHFGREANPIARLVLDAAGYPGLALYKLLIVAVVLATTHELLSRSPAAAKRLAVAAVALSAVPVVWSLHLLLSIRVHVWLIS